MGVVQRQSISSTIISYVGVGLGFFNKVVLFTNLLTESEVGFANLLPTLSLMFAQFAALGSANATLRFFPFFRQKEKEHNGFLLGFSLINLLGFAIFSLIFLLFQDRILAQWAENTPLLHSYFYLLFPFAFFYLLTNFFEAYLRSLYKISVMTLVKEILFRLPVTVGITLYFFGWIDFETFIFLYVGLVGVASLVPIVYLIYLRQLFFKPNFGRIWQRLYKRIGTYTLATLLSYSASVVLSYLDLFMLTFFVLEADIGVFSIMVFMTSVIIIPFKALMRISGAFVADFWKQKKMKELQRMYQRTSIISLMVGIFLFLGIWINRENVVSIMKNGDYARGLPVLLILGLARIFDMTAGLNGIILSTSRKFIYDMIFQVALIGIGIGTNLWLIPIYGIYGAAMATAISIVSINTLRVLAVWYLYDLQPFSWKMLYIIGTGLLGFWLVELIPQLPFLVDLLLRSVLFTLIFMGVMLRLELSPDVNTYVWQIGKKLGLSPLLRPFFKNNG